MDAAKVLEDQTSYKTGKSANSWVNRYSIATTDLSRAKSTMKFRIMTSQGETITLGITTYTWLPSELPHTDSDDIWDKSFAASQDLLSRLAQEAYSEYLAGETEDLDFDDNSDVL